MRKPLGIVTLFSLMTFILAGCGGGSGSNDGTTPTTNANPAAGTNTAVLKLQTSGTPDIPIAGISLTLKLPTGATILSNNQIVASGVCPSNALFAANYTPQNSTVRLSLVSTATFPPGEFATLNLQLDAGKSFTADDFVVAGTDIITSTATQLLNVSVTKTLTLL